MKIKTYRCELRSNPNTFWLTRLLLPDKITQTGKEQFTLAVCQLSINFISWEISLALLSYNKTRRFNLTCLRFKMLHLKRTPSPVQGSI